jgi:hypothetical protein
MEGFRGDTFAVSRRDNTWSAGGQLEHPSEVNSSTTTVCAEAIIATKPKMSTRAVTVVILTLLPAQVCKRSWAGVPGPYKSQPSW